MPKQYARAKRSPVLFIVFFSVLLIAGIALGCFAMSGWTRVEKAAAEVSAMPVPTQTPTVRPMAYTVAPNEVTPTPAPTATPSALVNGSSGEMVVQLQTRLQALGYYQGALDGQFGAGTQNAVKAFQRQHGLEADGAAGPKTLAVLYSDQARPYQATPTPKAYDVTGEGIPILVNKWNKLPDGFEPANLVTVRDQAGDLLLYDDKSFQGVGEAVDALISMIRAAKADGIDTWKLGGAYRTIKDQKRIFDNRVSKYLKENADATRSQAISHTRLTVADPGCSEHHTGLAFDLNVPGAYFVDTAQYLWLKQHCWDYGFIMRYTDEKEDITGIIGEEWHIRYVGLSHAQRIKELDYCLEEYVDYLKNNQ